MSNSAVNYNNPFLGVFTVESSTEAPPVTPDQRLSQWEIGQLYGYKTSPDTSFYILGTSSDVPTFFQLLISDSSGNWTFNGDVTINGDLAVIGDTDLTGPLNVTGDTTLIGLFDVTGDSTLTGSLDVVGNATITTADASVGLVVDTSAGTGVGITSESSGAAVADFSALAGGYTSVAPTETDTVANGITNSVRLGQAVFTGFSAAAAAEVTCTITNTLVTAASVILWSWSGVTADAATFLQSVTPGAGTIAFVFRNNTGAGATDTASKTINFWVIN